MIVATEAAQKRDLPRLEKMLSPDGLQKKPGWVVPGRA
jgi:hypothetical protein